MDIEYKPIGVIHSPHRSLEGMPIQPAGAVGIKGHIKLNSEFAEGLKDIEGFSHIILIYHFHGSSGFNLQVVPFMDTESRGVFATRAPKRPNAIGLSIVKLCDVQGDALLIENVDILDGTPLLDIKPYVPDFDEQKSVRTGWLEKSKRKVSERTSDDRFI